MLEAMTIESFFEKTGINPSQTRGSVPTEVVSLREIVRVTSVRPMMIETLEKLLKSVLLASGENVYANTRIKRVRIDPEILDVGQTFVEESKIVRFLNEFEHIFREFSVTAGVAKLTAHMVKGYTTRGTYAIVYYLPPIVEQPAISGQLILLDGMHRNFLARAIGTTLEVILLKDVTFAQPFSPHDWTTVKMVKDKPPKKERFFDLRPSLFRKLTDVGIDG